MTLIISLRVLLIPSIVLAEIEKPNWPDGEIFRKDLAEVISGTQQVKHKGVYPEQKIIEYMDQTLALFKRNFFARTSYSFDIVSNDNFIDQAVSLVKLICDPRKHSAELFKLRKFFKKNMFQENRI